MTVFPEEYEFTCALLYSEESFLRGSKARVVVQPRLFLNGMPANMKIVRETTISATVFNEREIPSTYVFNRGSTAPQVANFDHKSDIEISLPVKGLVSRVEIVVTGNITKLNGEN